MVKVVNSYSNRKYGSFDSMEEAMRFIRRKGLEYTATNRESRRYGPKHNPRNSGSRKEKSRNARLS